MVPTAHPLTRYLLRLVAVGLGLVLLLGAPRPCQAAKVLKRKSHKPPAATRQRHLSPQVPVADLPFSADIERYLGIPYRRGGSGRGGMDCSGFTRSFFADVFGIDLPHNSRAISRLSFMEELPLDEEAFRASDLLFFGNGKNRINHVGIYLADGLFVHASTSSGVTISSLETPYWQKRLVASRRVRLLDDPLDLQEARGVQAPDGLWDTTEPLQSWTLAYQQSVVPDMLDIGLEFTQGSAWHATAPGPWRALLASDPYPGADGSLEWQWGWRARLDVYPLAGLQITPSLSRYEGSQAGPPYDDDWHAYTLATTVASPAARWSLVLAAQAESLEAMFRPDGPEGSNWRSLDLALGFGYEVADGVNLSIMGTHGAADLEDSRRADGHSDGVRDLFFRIEVVY